MAVTFNPKNLEQPAKAARYTFMPTVPTKTETVSTSIFSILLIPIWPVHRLFKAVSHIILRDSMLEHFDGINDPSKDSYLHHHKAYQYEIKHKDGVELGHFKSKKNTSETIRPTVIFCRGNDATSYADTSKLENYMHVYQYYAERGIDVITFDYIGTGNTEGQASEEGVYQTAETAYEYARIDCKIPHDNILVHGFSLGSAPGAKLAADHKTHLILDRPFAKASLIADKEAYETTFKIGSLSIPIGKILFPLRWLLRGMMRSSWHLPTEKYIKNVERRWVCLTGQLDTGMDDKHLHHSKRIYNQFAKAKKMSKAEKKAKKSEFLVKVEGAEHFTSLTDSNVSKHLDAFLTKINWLQPVENLS